MPIHCLQNYGFFWNVGSHFTFHSDSPGSTSERPQARIDLWLLLVGIVCRLEMKCLISSGMDMVGCRRPAGFPGGSDGQESTRNAEDLGCDDPLVKGMATDSSILAWRIPWTEEPGGLQSMGLHRVGHNWVTNTYTPIIGAYAWDPSLFSSQLVLFCGFTF